MTAYGRKSVLDSVARAAESTRMTYWLVKSEPDVFGIDDLAREHSAMWEGVRNYQARNMMRDDMRIGDEVLFYHSSCPEPGVAGIAKVASKPHADPTQFDARSPYFDPKSDPKDPRWMLVDLAFVRKFRRIVTLAEIKADPKLSGMGLTRRGNRLSVMPVEAKHFRRIVSLE